MDAIWVWMILLILTLVQWAVVKKLLGLFLSIIQKAADLTKDGIHAVGGKTFKAVGAKIKNPFRSNDKSDSKGENNSNPIGEDGLTSGERILTSAINDLSNKISSLGEIKKTEQPKTDYEKTENFKELLNSNESVKKFNSDVIRSSVAEAHQEIEAGDTRSLGTISIEKVAEKLEVNLRTMQNHPIDKTLRKNTAGISESEIDFIQIAKEELKKNGVELEEEEEKNSTL